MSAGLSETTISIVKSTVPTLEAHGLDISNRMYERLFCHPEIKALFNQSHHGATGAQPKALADSVLAYARYIDNLEVLAPAVHRITQKHVGLMIQPSHYPFVADALVAAIADVLGDAASPAILAAWGEAYWALAHIMIGEEAKLYRINAETEGGWTGLREFAVEQVTEESTIIRSFLLRPVDGRPVIRHKPGQYLTFTLNLPEQPETKRNYSISSAPNGATYRITVKREPALLPGVPAGRVSNWLHDTVRLSSILRTAPPAGEFFLDEMNNSVALVSGGVGFTPMMSMLETIVARREARQVAYVHGAINSAVHAMGAHAKALAAKSSGATVTNFYADPLPGDVLGRDYDERGFITPNWLRRNTSSDTIYYLCGPRPFLRALWSGLRQEGVPAAQIRYEFFGPADELLAA